MKFHKLAALFPLIEGNVFNDLVKDIDTHGLMEPIWLYEDQILDGRNRYRACQELGIEPEYRTYTGDDPISFVISLNLVRRHLSLVQRSCIAVELMPLLQEEAATRQAEAGGKDPGPLPVNLTEALGDARDQAGERLSISGTYVDTAVRIAKNNPALFERMQEGRVPSMSLAKELEPLKRPQVIAAVDDYMEKAQTMGKSIARAQMRKKYKIPAPAYTKSDVLIVESSYTEILRVVENVTAPELHAKWLNWAKRLVDIHQKRSPNDDQN